MRKDWIETEGTVASVYAEGGGDDRHYSIVFTYKVDGHYYGGTFTRGTPDYYVDQILRVRYDPANPEDNDLVEKERLKKIIFGALAAVIILSFVISLLFH